MALVDDAAANQSMKLQGMHTGLQGRLQCAAHSGLENVGAEAAFQDTFDFCQAANSPTGPARKSVDGDIAYCLLRIFAQELARILP